MPGVQWRMNLSKLESVKTLANMLLHTRADLEQRIFSMNSSEFLKYPINCINEENAASSINLNPSASVILDVIASLDLGYEN